MTDLKLTALDAGATSRATGFQGRPMEHRIVQAGLAVLSMMGASGCINIAAPEEPIVIELNVNIRAEVLYRLAEDASNTIDENADIF